MNARRAHSFTISDKAIRHAASTKSLSLLSYVRSTASSQLINSLCERVVICVDIILLSRSFYSRLIIITATRSHKYKQQKYTKLTIWSRICSSFFLHLIRQSGLGNFPSFILCVCVCLLYVESVSMRVALAQVSV